MATVEIPITIIDASGNAVTSGNCLARHPDTNAVLTVYDNRAKSNVISSAGSPTPLHPNSLGRIEGWMDEKDCPPIVKFELTSLGGGLIDYDEYRPMVSAEASVIVLSEIKFAAIQIGGFMEGAWTSSYIDANFADNFLKCQGQNISRSTYSALFAAIGTQYGSGDGSTTFTLPDFRKKVKVDHSGDDLGLFKSIPIGALLPYAGYPDDLPPGFLLCDGSVISRTTYDDLFTILGTYFNTTGESGSQFRLPDFRGRVPFGENGSSGRLTANGSRGNSSGEEKHGLTYGEMPSHSHDDGSLTSDTHGGHARNVYDPGHAHGVNSGNFLATSPGGSNANINASGSSYKLIGSSGGAVTGIGIYAGGAHSHDILGSTGLTGGGGDHNNMPPYQVINWIISGGQNALNDPELDYVPTSTLIRYA